MKQIKTISFGKRISTFLLSLLLISCGGGGGDTVAHGGISGTGITMGRITNFGSIVVHGIRFDVNNATFIRDGATATLGQADFSVGEFVTLQRTLNADGTTGTASEVVFSDLIEGSVTAASVDGITLEVLHQTINTDPLTVYIGFSTLNTLSVGNIVEISGVKNSDNEITATSIRLKATNFIANVSENEIKGTITQVDLGFETFTIGNITIEYGNATLQGFNGQTPQIGQFVEAKSNQDIIGATFIASRIEREEEYLNLKTGTEAEIEGQVTSFNSSINFAVNGLPVITTSATRYEKGNAANITLNAFIEVEGRVNTAGVLVAEKIEFDQNDSSELNELEGNIQRIDLAANSLTLRGQVIVITSSTLMVDESNQNLPSLTLDDLSVGERIEVYFVVQNNGEITAIKLEREDRDD